MLRSSTPSLRYLVLALIGAQALLLLGLLGIPPVGGSSEAREMQVVDIMQRTNELVLPLRNGLVPSKPPLFHWFALGLAKLNGHVDELVVRLPSVLSCVGLLVFVFGVSRTLARLARTRDVMSDEAGFLALVCTTLMYGFTHMAQRAMVDMTFAFWCWAAWYFGVRAAVEFRLGEFEKVRQWKTLFWCSCGFAVLARGPIGIFLPTLLIFVGTCCITGVRAAARIWAKPTLGWIVCIAIFLPWYLLAFERGGDAFLARQLFFENLKRFQGGEFVNAEPFWYYLPSISRTAFPWSLILVGMILVRVKRLGGRFEPEALVPTVMLVAGMLLFSIASGKRHSYMLPLYPFLGMAVSSLLNEWRHTLSDCGQQRVLRTLCVVSHTSSVILLALAVAIGAAASLVAGSNPLHWELQVWLRNNSVPITLFIGVASLVLILGSRFGGHNARIFFAWFGLASVYMVALCIGTGLKGRIKNFEQIAVSVMEHVPAGSDLAVIKHERDEFFDPVLYYVHRPVELLDRDLEFQECREYTIALGKWFDETGKARLRDRGNELIEIGRYNDLSDAMKGAREREIVLFRCRQETGRVGDGLDYT